MYNKSKLQEIDILMGNFKAKVECEKYGKTAGPHGLASRNEERENLMDGCKQKKLVITNACFVTHPRHRCTCTIPGDRARNRIDYIVINKKFRTCICNARACPGAKASSDHNPVIAKFKIHLRSLKRPKRKPRFFIDALKNPGLNTKFFAVLLEKLLQNRNEQNSQYQ